MELVPARSLDRVVAEDGPLSPGRAADMGRQVLAAVATAHAAGVLHRDVKPSNVLLAKHGRALLTDFGVATIGGPGTGPGRTRHLAETLLPAAIQPPGGAPPATAPPATAPPATAPPATAPPATAPAALGPVSMAPPPIWSAGAIGPASIGPGWMCTAARHHKHHVITFVIIGAVIFVAAAVVAAQNRAGSLGAGVRSQATGAGQGASPGTEQSAAGSRLHGGAVPAGGRGLPAGFSWYSQPAGAAGSGTAGFSVALPTGWRVTHRGMQTYIEDPEGGRFLELDLTPHSRSSMLAEFAWLQRQSVRQGTFPGYPRYFIRLVRYRTPPPQSGRSAGEASPAGRRTCSIWP
jgi:hypothetical protein